MYKNNNQRWNLQRNFAQSEKKIQIANFVECVNEGDSEKNWFDKFISSVCKIFSKDLAVKMFLRNSELT